MSNCNLAVGYHNCMQYNCCKAVPLGIDVGRRNDVREK